MTYSNIGEVSRITELSIDTLRYYEKEELIDIERGTNKIRQYSQKDIEMIRFIKCLKAMGMEIKEIKRYVDLEKLGNETVEERIIILERLIKNINQRSRNLKKYIQSMKKEC
ncbi:MerR family transcriptional regulator [Enterococcus sp. AZ007]|uniref:MerR family transcriptional regulator n=1 Tax=Enterococcus sp. AZ007 TaxID=2774839 RepID=UPI003F274E77